MHAMLNNAFFDFPQQQEARRDGTIKAMFMSNVTYCLQSDRLAKVVLNCRILSWKVDVSYALNGI